ncbi:MAG: hypothetical protein C0622_06995 [Desulfuromonas sp.]|nr:MAG: hypothetical protein C0622_06995 [Desulfuromonas sp.]
MTDKRPHQDEDVLFCRLSHDFANNHPKTVEKLSGHQLAYSIAGLVLGVICILGGIALFMNGITGSTSWTAKIIGAESNISDAAPGAILFIVGLFVVLVTRYKMHIHK